jgi:hypothetical protein
MSGHFHALTKVTKETSYLVVIVRACGEVAWRGLPCSRWGVAYAWRDRASMLPPGCGNFNKVLSYGVTM